MGIKTSFIELFGELSKAGGLTRDFEPTSLTSALTREMEGAKKVLVYRSFVPDTYWVSINSLDFREIKPLVAILQGQLEEILKEKIESAGYQLLRKRITVKIAKQPGLGKGEVQIKSQFTQRSEKGVSEIFDEEDKTTKVYLPDQAASNLDTVGTILDAEAPEDEREKTVAKLVVLKGPEGKKEYVINKARTIIGRIDADIALPAENRLVSRRHAEIKVRDGKYYLKDLGSRNGTFVNNREIRESEIKNGDRISVGDIAFEFSMDIDSE